MSRRIEELLIRFNPSLMDFRLLPLAEREVGLGEERVNRLKLRLTMSRVLQRTLCFVDGRLALPLLR